MKKTRNSFFAENNMNYQGFNPMMPNNGYQANANSSFYAGPINNNQIDYQERISKIERQLNRLEHRVNNLENKSTKSTDDFDDNSNNMYMI